jgi:hypothetical protein
MIVLATYRRSHGLVVVRGAERWEGRCVTKSVNRSWDLMPPDMVWSMLRRRSCLPVKADLYTRFYLSLLHV